MYCQQRKTSEVRCQHQKLVFSATQHFSFFLEKRILHFFYSIFTALIMKLQTLWTYFFAKLNYGHCHFFHRKNKWFAVSAPKSKSIAVMVLVKLKKTWFAKALKRTWKNSNVSCKEKKTIQVFCLFKKSC